ncbi:MAG: LPS-assembly protein LptD [Deltaproteobacteria bacterium]|nr:LPS-assembly protein LptD [Deltaproteobacteria bacterium]
MKVGCFLNNLWRKRDWLLTLCCVFGCFFCVEIFLSNEAVAQVEPPNRKYLFIEDQYKRERDKIARMQREQAERQQLSVGELDSNLSFDIDSPSINYESDGDVLRAEGGLTVSVGPNVFEADSGTFNVKTREAVLKGDVKFSDPTGSIFADVAELNLADVTGKLQEAEISFKGNDALYSVHAKEVQKYKGEVFDFTDASLTTCQCPDGDACAPWHLEAKEVEITRNGYGKSKDTAFYVRDVPVFYLPYMFFPAKSDRQTGFLPATLGFQKNGTQLKTPFFWAIDESTDLTLVPMAETSVRYGGELEFRKLFSRTSDIEVGATYFDESARDGELLGTDTTGLHDPTLDVNRFGGYLDHVWRWDSGILPVQAIVNANYVSDDLFLREFENEKIAPFNARYVTSRGLVRSSLGSYSADLAVEYNQALVSDDDIVFQRLPELGVNGISRFKPFGDNSYGVKLVASSNLEAVNFQRKEGFHGSRFELNENLKVPFHYRNYFDVELGAGLVGTQYKLDNRDLVDAIDPSVVLERSSDRLVPSANGKVSTVVEKVFDVPRDSFLKKISELGTYGRSRELVRMKHTVQPVVKYRFVPFVGQEGNPQFDAGDRLAEQSFFSYGLIQRLFARFDRRNEYLYGIEEATPEVGDLGSLRVAGSIEDSLAPDLYAGGMTGEYIDLRRADIREIAALKLVQSFDVLEDRKDIDENRRPLSDLNAGLMLYPNGYVKLEANTDFDVEEQELSTYSLASQLMDKRGDMLRARLSFIEESVRQLETSLELHMTDTLKLGYYTRYDDFEQEFIENQVGMRLSSRCNCWLFDVLLSDSLNPDRTKLSFTVTLVGLGELSNSLFVRDDNAS